MNSPGSSQAPGHTIFRKADGTPFGVWAQVDGIRNRPKLARLLKGGGATIRTEQKDADIMLVDQYSVAGQGFLQEWGGDPHKLILHYRWAEKCAEEGKFLGEVDAYGGFKAVPMEIRDDEDGEGPHVVQQPIEAIVPSSSNVLPTPRPSPENIAQGTSISQTLSPKRNSMGPPAAPGPSTSTAQTPHPKAMSPAVTGSSIASLPTDSAHPPSTMMSMQQFPAPAMYGMPGQMMLTPNPMVVVVQQPSMPMPMGQNLQHFPQYWTPEYRASVIDHLELNPDAYPDSARLIAQLRAIDSTMAVNCPPHVTFPPRDTSSRMSSVNVNGASSRSASPDLPLARSIDVKEKKKRKVKRESETPARASSTDGPLFHSDGKPMVFWIDVSLRGRGEIVGLIKSHGGGISSNSDFEHVDFAILEKPSNAKPGSNRMKEFEGWLKSADLKGVPAMHADFVRDCVAKNRLLNPQRYAFAVPGKTKRKKRVDVESEDEEEEVEDRKPVVTKPPKKKPAPAPVPTQTARKVSKVKPIVKEPLQTSGYAKPGVRFAYLPEEIEQALEIGLEMFTADPDTNITAVAKRLQTEMPRHSASSWMTTLSHSAKYKDRWNKVCKQGGIRHRKIKEEAAVAARRQSMAADTGGSSMTIDPKPAVSQPGPMPPNEPPRSPAVDHARPNPYEQDLDDIAEFFAFGQDEEFGDGEERETQRDAIFAKLEHKTRCRTMINWGEFHREYHQEIQRLVDEKYQEAQMQ